MKKVLFLWLVVLGIVPSAIHAVTCPTGGGILAVSATQTFKYTATNPPGCQRTACNFFLGVNTSTIDSNYLDFWMEGSAAGYIAVGFSPTGRMASSDVIMCGKDNTASGGVGVVDAYNTGYSSARDSTTQDVCPRLTSVTSGRITCSFSRPIITGDTAQDRDLSSLNYLLLAAVGNAPAGSGATLAPSQHSVGSVPTSQAVIVAVATGTSAIKTAFPKTILTKVHGILMLIAWPLLAVTGIFFAAWMKPALGPPPMPPKWFTIHRILMLASMFVGAAGFFIVFIANTRNDGIISLSSNGGLAHFLIGIIVMFLHIINPIISAFRCLPTSPRRWIFNILHGSLIGLAVEILALVNCGIGLALFETNGYSSSPGSYRTLGFYVTYAALLFLLFVLLFGLFTGIAIVTGGEKGLKLGPALIKPILEYYFGETKTEQKLADNNIPPMPVTPTPAPPTPSQTPSVKQPKSKDVVLRWIGLSLFLCITITFILIVIVLVAV